MLRSLFFLLTAAAATVSSAAPLTVPGMCAYGLPNTRLSMDRKSGSVRQWAGKEGQQLIWYGELKATGELLATVNVTLATPHADKVKLSVYPISKPAEKQVHEVVVSSGTIAFPSVQIKAVGYHAFQLENASPDAVGDILSLQLDGAAAAGAHFNDEERRNAASVHLGYPVEKGTDVVWFYNEVTARHEPVATFYMACGFHRGYFGMQVNSPTERRIIFSVWDSGNEGIDRKKVADDDRVKLLAKGDDVYAGDFGNEGTGGHSHLKYLWKTNEPQRFLLGARPEGDKTTYTAYYFHPDKQDWSLIASFRAPKDGKFIKGMHSFVENFGGDTGHFQRSADFGPPWACDASGKWHELLQAGFTHDPTGKEKRKDYFAMPLESGFRLSNGGWVDQPKTAYGDKIQRKALGTLPKWAEDAEKLQR